MTQRHEEQSWVGEAIWQENFNELRNQVRQELISRQLSEHLPPPNEELAIIDVGCGQGTQLIKLAQSGYSVTGVDISLNLLDKAEANLSNEPPDVRERVTLKQGDISKLESVVDRAYDAVLCHGVLMYLPSLKDSLNKLSAILKPNGLMSVLTRNRASIAMRAGMMGNWTAALAGFDARHYNNRVGVSHTRADEPQEVIETLKGLGIDLVQWYGVRLFTDHWGDVKPAEDFDALLAAEEEAGRRDPYRQLTSLTHVIGKKSNLRIAAAA